MSINNNKKLSYERESEKEHHSLLTPAHGKKSKAGGAEKPRVDTQAPA